MSAPGATHKDLAALLGVSETTVKSYRRKFPGCIPVANRGKPIRFTPEAVAVVARIRDLFETGMSIDEVRVRLATEFVWVKPEAPAQTKEEPGNGSRPGVSPELSLGVSNMAKSLVAMTQQQKAILTRIQGLENTLEDIGAAGLAEAVNQHKSHFEERLAELDRLDNMVTTLAAGMQALSGRLDNLLARRPKSAEEYRHDAPEGEASPSRPVEEPVLEGEEQIQRTATIIPLLSGKPQSLGCTPSMPAAESHREPERRFFSLPLVVRTEQGQFISVGGKGRGPFSINDLKAMLIYGYTPPNHFTLDFEPHRQGWWLTLEQKNNGQSIRMLLTEQITHRGSAIAEILQIQKNGESAHPTEICGIIDSFSV